MRIQSTIIDLYECEKKSLANAKRLREFPLALCKEIKMKPFGKPVLKKFGKGKLEGYSLTLLQFIETSSITIHVDEKEKKMFVDVCSCKRFNAFKAKDFSKQYFNAKKAKFRTIHRE